MVIELLDVQFWSEIILVISNRTRAARSFDFEITRMISDQIALHSIQITIIYRRENNTNSIKQLGILSSVSTRSEFASLRKLRNLELKVTYNQRQDLQKHLLVVS